METLVKKKIYKGEVTQVSQAAKDLFYIKIKADGICAKAGQFISIYCGELTLRRPFSVMSAKDNELTVLFKLKGKGTDYMRKLSVGDVVDFSGAFGNGFHIENKKSLIIGAGVGVAPVHFLKEELDKQGIENYLMAGFLNKENIPVDLNIDEIVTNDGSAGQKGSVIDYLEKAIAEYKPEKIYSCGPSIVLKLVSEIAQKYNIPAEIAMEKEMACSIGVCRGCVIELKNGKNASVCKDGPVFHGEEIKW